MHFNFKDGDCSVWLLNYGSSPKYIKNEHFQILLSPDVCIYAIFFYTSKLKLKMGAIVGGESHLPVGNLATENARRCLFMLNALYCTVPAYCT